MKTPCTLHAIWLGAVLLSALTARGDLLLADHSSANVILRYDGSSVSLFASDPDMVGPSAMAYHSSGDLLVLNEYSQNVLRFNRSTGALAGTLIPTSSLAAAGISDPDDMEIGADGNLYIASHFNEAGGIAIHKFDGLTGAYLGPYTPAVPLRHQHGLAFGTGGHIYQGNVDAGAIERFDGISGAPLGAFTTGDPVPGISELVFGGGNLYVSTGFGAGVARFDASSGAFIEYLPATIGSSYWGMVVEGSDLYGSNISTGALERFDAASGAFISSSAIGVTGFDIIRMIPEPGSAVLTLIGVAAINIIRSRRITRPTLRPARPAQT